MKPEIEVVWHNDIELKRAGAPKDPGKPKWGNWRWVRGNNTLVYGRNKYWIDLDKATSCAQLLDWIFQVFPKTWMTPQDVVDLLNAFRYTLNPQANMCSWGKDVVEQRKKGA